MSKRGAMIAQWHCLSLQSLILHLRPVFSALLSYLMQINCQLVTQLDELSPHTGTSAFIIYIFPTSREQRNIVQLCTDKLHDIISYQTVLNKRKFQQSSKDDLFVGSVPFQKHKSQFKLSQVFCNQQGCGAALDVDVLAFLFTSPVMPMKGFVTQ